MKTKTLFYFCRCEDNKKRNSDRDKFILLNELLNNI